MARKATAEEVTDIAQRRMLSNRARFAELIEAGILTEEQLDAAAKEHERTRRSMGRILLDLGYVRESDLPRVLAAWKGLPFVQLTDIKLDATAADLVPEGIARRHNIVPIGFDDETLVVAVADPMNIIVLDDIRFITGMDVKLVVATQVDIHEALNRLHTLDRSAEMLLDTPEEEVETAALDAVEEAPIVKAVNRIISQAVAQRASDVHVEPGERDITIRYRIDGVLHEVMRLPKAHQPGLISRLKVMADADIAEKRLPQDGRITMKVDRQPIDLRVATLPSVWGEEVIVRVLDRSTSVQPLAELGYGEGALKRFESAVRRPYGMVIVAGPTGSGKSTTLYATLNLINDTSKKIITVEDPVEYRLDGLRQIQVHHGIGFGFASALRAILRSDPDIIMLGEIRDRETATIAVQAALTGHLVLSTLHTNDAPSAATRLVEMGVEPFLVSSALACVLAQRLARRLCERCAESYVPDQDMLLEIGFPFGGRAPKLRRPVGCTYCADTGYRGRIALAEVMTVTEEIERLTVERASSEVIRKVAREQKMKSLLEDGWEKVRAGITSLEEVLRVVS